VVDAELLAILVCPENKTPVTSVDAALIERINGRIEEGTLKYRNGETVSELIDGGLLREDGAYLYAIRDDIPVMLIDESIPMEQLG
jgi:uncharacterized protein YbaR (Trm112 family)